MRSFSEVRCYTNPHIYFPLSLRSVVVCSEVGAKGCVFYFASSSGCSGSKAAMDGRLQQRKNMSPQTVFGRRFLADWYYQIGYTVYCYIPFFPFLLFLWRTLAGLAVLPVVLPGFLRADGPFLSLCGASVDDRG